ncbi:MAG: HEAT repeat domain-containing protein [Elusimicrobia bacterium]|nr:HEAT repeat domain-containing protein [Elusimicrobiota bacterium]
MKKVKQEAIRKIIPEFEGAAYILTEEDLFFQQSRSALTGLPGNPEIEKAIKERFLKNGSPDIVVYFDINNFKAYNDVYGFMKGDIVIKTLADYFRKTASGFAGHIGGDDFVAIMEAEKFDSFADDILRFFDSKLKVFYSADDFERGAIVTFDREGRRKMFPLMGITVVAFGNSGGFSSPSEVGEFAARLKKIAKLSGKRRIGNSVVFRREDVNLMSMASVLKDAATPLEVRRAVCEALGSAGDYSYEKILIGILNSRENIFLKKSALYALGKLRSVEAVSEIARFLKNPSAHLRMRAVEALGEIGKAESASRIIPLLDDGNVFVRRSAVAALGRLGSSSSAGALERKLDDSSVRNDAIVALASIGVKDFVDGLPVLIANDTISDNLKLTALEIVGQKGSRKIAGLVLESLASSKIRGSRLVSRTLTALSAVIEREGNPIPEIPRKIFSLADSRSWKIRAAAARFFSVCGVEGIAALKKLCRDFSEAVRSRAVSGLRYFPGEFLFVLEFFADFSPQVRFAAADTIKFMKIPPERKKFVTAKLRLLLKDLSYEVSSAAAKSIIKITAGMEDRG